jgi:hypothetical protein
VPEDQNIEIAHKLSERDDGAARKRPLEEALEIAEVILLAIVAIATAWSGYQAAKWDGHQALQYGEATKLRFEADSASTRGGQVLLGDASNFEAWLQVHDEGNTKLAELFVRRFTPEYKLAFEAWLKTDPFTSKTAPAGPAYMPEYHNPLFEKAAEYNKQAAALFEAGTLDRETADKYVRDTVLFASVLFLIGIGQRFKLRGARVTANIAATTLLLFTLLTLVALPRI